jgi:hypothetical protein
MARTRASKPTAGHQDTDPAKTAKPDHTTSAAANGGANAEPSCDPDGKRDPDAYAVGYGRPPLHSRFKPGQSGNPKEREKQSRNMRTVLQQILNEDMQIRDGVRVRRMPASEALVRTILSRVFKGDPRAMASFLVLVRHCRYGADQDEPAAEMLAGTDLQAIIQDYIDRNGSEVRTASKTKPAEEPPDTAPTAPSVTSPKKPK